MDQIRQPQAMVWWWSIEIRAEEYVIDEKKTIAQTVGREFGVQLALVQDPKDRPGVLCLRSQTMRASLTPPEFEQFRNEVGRRFAEALRTWVSIKVMCNVYELHCVYETPGAEAIL
jgi:hypothetical protein